MVLASNPVIQSNRETVAAFLKGKLFGADDGHRDRTDGQRHLICPEIPLSHVVDELLVPFRVTSTVDSPRYIGLLLQLGRALESDPTEACAVYQMSPRAQRRRDIDERGELTNLFQGEAPVDPKERRGEVYPGDRAICSEDIVTIQIHTLNLTKDKGSELIAEKVPAIAVWVPARLAKAWISQDQPNQDG